MMGVVDDNIFEVGGLDEEEVKFLFRERVGNIIDYEEYNVMEDKLLKYCVYLLFVVVVFVDVLKNQDLFVWKCVVV